MKTSSWSSAAALVVLLSSTACGSKSRPTLTSTSTRTAAHPASTVPVHVASPKLDAGLPPPSTTDERAVSAAAARTARAIEKVLCTDDPCCVTGLDEMGTDRKGQELFVAELNGDGDCLAPRRNGRPAPRVEAVDESESDGHQPCTPGEFHLVARKGGRVRAVVLLAESCNIPADMPEAGDSIEVDREKQLVRHASGAGNRVWWGESVTIGVAPLRLVRIEKGTFDRVDHDNSTDESWDWDAFSGTTHWAPIDCKATARTDAGVPATDEDGNPPRLDVHAVRIPMVDLPTGFAATGWRTVSLAACSAPFDYAIHDEGSSPADARARAVVGNGTLFVEVWDDHLVGPGKNWVKDDHLELWLGRAQPDGDECDSATRSIAQWGIRVADGAVFSAYGAPKPLVGVERALTKRGARFKIPLPEGGDDRITVVYSNGDGHRQTRLIATSELRYGDPATLGETFAVSSAHAVCVVKNGALETRTVPLKPSEDAALMDGLF